MKFATYGGCDVETFDADIATVQADALIAAINSAGVWEGFIHRAINRCAGLAFHYHPAKAIPLRHGQTVIASGVPRHKGNFRDVVFVVDDLVGPLREVVKAALRCADDRGYKIVTMPVIRDEHLGIVEKTAAEVIREMLIGIDEFFAERPSAGLKRLVIVCYPRSARG